jgi:acyl-CoA thioesterase
MSQPDRTTFPRPSDLELLHLSVDPDLRHSHFELVPDLARHDGALYGGTAIAISVVAAEAATDQGVLWITTQYVASATLGDTITVTTDVLARGRNVTQVQVTGRLGETVLFVSVGSTATPRQGGLEGQYQTMPAVTPPGDTGPLTFGLSRPGDIAGFTRGVEYRLAYQLGPKETPLPMTLWARLTDLPMTPAGISFLADMVPPAIAQAAGKVGGGTSLDNSLRFGHLPDDLEWVLLEMRGQMAVGGHAHGSVEVWSPEGALLAVGGQSTNMRYVYTQEEVDQMAADAGRPPLIAT